MLHRFVKNNLDGTGRAEKREKATHGVALFTQDRLEFDSLSLRCTVVRPVALFEVFLDLPALVTMALRLDRTVVRLAERVFWIPNDLRDGFSGFAHNEGCIEGKTQNRGPARGWLETNRRYNNGLCHHV